MARRSPAERLARWIHKVWVEGQPEGYQEPWGHLSEWRQEFYLRVAKRLLTDPPPELKAGRRKAKA